MKKSSKALRLAVITVVTFASVLESHAEELLRLTPGIAKSVVVEGAAAGSFSSIIGDPKIADVVFGPKNVLWLVGLTEGTTNIIMSDINTGMEMYNAVIVVSDNSGYNNRVHVHNKALLTSYTVYRCDPTCLYSNEVTATEPAALPYGNLKSTGTLGQNAIPTIARPTQSSRAP